MRLAAAAKMQQQQNTKKYADVVIKEIFFHTACNYRLELTVDECHWGQEFSEIQSDTGFL